MSNNKPTATAVIRFFSDKSVTVELDSLVGVSPRRLERANHLLMREFRGKRHAHNARRHTEAREEKVAADAAAVEKEAAFHKAEDKRLAEAAKDAEERHEAVAAVGEIEEEVEKEALVKVEEAANEDPKPKPVAKKKAKKKAA